MTNELDDVLLTLHEDLSFSTFMLKNGEIFQLNRFKMAAKIT